MTWRDKLEIGVQENAEYRKDNRPLHEVAGPELPQGPGRSAEIPHARGAAIRKSDDQQQHAPEMQSGVAGWDEDGGAAASDGGLTNEAESEVIVERSSRRAALDSSHESSRRGEHRYPDAHQTDAERKGRDERDALKRRLGDSR